jgi:hypothetical protein
MDATPYVSHDVRKLHDLLDVVRSEKSTGARTRVFPIFVMRLEGKELRNCRQGNVLRHCTMESGRPPEYNRKTLVH